MRLRGNDFGRNADGHGVCGNVFGDDAANTDDGIMTDADSSDDLGSVAQEDAVSEFRA